MENSKLKAFILFFYLVLSDDLPKKNFDFTKVYRFPELASIEERESLLQNCLSPPEKY
jgi:hypothetical protein